MTTEPKKIGTFKHRTDYEDQLHAGLQQIIAVNAQKIVRGDRPHKLALLITGGGTRFIDRLCRIEGASSTLYDHETPYDEARSDAILGERVARIESYVSRVAAEEFALAMLGRSVRELRDRQAKLADRGKKGGVLPRIWGVSLTASVKTTRVRKGPDRVFLGMVDQDQDGTCYTIEAVFERETWSREDQNFVCELLAFNLIVERLHEAGFYEPEATDRRIHLKNADLPGKLFSAEKRYQKLGDYLSFDEFLTRATPIVRSPVTEDLLTTERRYTTYSLMGIPGIQLAEHCPHKLYCSLPTSINPLTEAHRFLCDALEMQGYQPVLELTDHHPDKGTLSSVALLVRLQDCFGREYVRVSKEGYFADKATTRAKNDRTFAIGYDVAEKILDKSLPRYRDDLETLKRLGALFFVFSRVVVDKTTGERRRKSLSDLDVPVEYRPLFRGIDLTSPDVSSSMIRIALGV